MERVERAEIMENKVAAVAAIAAVAGIATVVAFCVHPSSAIEGRTIELLGRGLIKAELVSVS